MKQSDNFYLAVQDELPIEPLVERFFKLPEGAIFLPTNRRQISLPRKIAQFLQYNENLVKFKTPRWREIASRYPAKRNKHMNHASVIHNVNSVIDIMQVDRKFREMVFDCQIEIWGMIKYKN